MGYDSNFVSLSVCVLRSFIVPHSSWKFLDICDKSNDFERSELQVIDLSVTMIGIEVLVQLRRSNKPMLLHILFVLFQFCPQR